MAERSLMEINSYQEKINEISQIKVDGLLYATLNLSGATGSFVNQIKTILEEKDGKIHPNDKSELVKVLGDVLACVTNVADELYITLEDVALLNIQKLLNTQNDLKDESKKRIDKLEKNVQ